MDPLTQNQVVARCIDCPDFRLAAGTAVMVNGVEQLTIKTLENHAVT